MRPYYSFSSWLVGGRRLDVRSSDSGCSVEFDGVVLVEDDSFDGLVSGFQDLVSGFSGVLDWLNGPSVSGDVPFEVEDCGDCGERSRVALEEYAAASGGRLVEDGEGGFMVVFGDGVEG